MFKKEAPLNYLETTPNRKYEHELLDDGIIHVLVPRFTDRILGKYLQPKLKSPYIRANLDEFGSATWLLMDGKTKVDSIADKLTEQFGESIQPVHPRLTFFLTHLYKAGFITFNELERK